MQDRPQRFISRILLFHGLLLLAVLTLVALASAEIYRSTSTHAIEQAQSRQELLADETSRAISTFYSSIIGDLGWLEHRPIPVGRGGRNAGGRGGGRTPQTGAQQQNSRGGAAGQNQPGRGGAAAAPPRGLNFEQRPAEDLAEQLGSRVAELFSYNKTNGDLVAYLPPKSTLKAEDLSAEMKTWLNSVAEVRVSRFMKLRDQGVSLVAADFGAADPSTLLVAVVPGEEIESTFLPLLNDQHQASATLADAQLQVISSTNAALADISLMDFRNADMQAMISSYLADPKLTTVLFSQPLQVFAIGSAGPVTLG
ncbi:MAG: hypothetical protein ABSH22_22345, partial [Tepidisphaeraceae bacterium]